MRRVTKENERLQGMDFYGIYKSVFFVSAQFHCQPKLYKGRRVAGFSLVEVLAVICLIGILSSVALGWYSGDNRAAIERMTHQRNAQEIVSLGVCATVSGAEFVVKDDKQASAVNLIVGVTGEQGEWKGKMFRLTNLKPNDLPGALKFVKFESDLLLYDPTGQQP